MIEWGFDKTWRLYHKTYHWYSSKDMWTVTHRHMLAIGPLRFEWTTYEVKPHA